MAEKIKAALQVQRSDWSGETVTVQVDLDGMTFGLMGYEFHLKWVPWPRRYPDGLEMSDEEYTDLCRTLESAGYYDILGDQWNERLGTVCLRAQGGSYSTDGVIERDSDGDGVDDREEVVRSAVRLLCNIL